MKSSAPAPLLVREMRLEELMTVFARWKLATIGPADVELEDRLVRAQPKDIPRHS
jgi:hypothetical protein